MAGSSKSRNRLSTCLRVLLSLRKVPARKAGTLIRIRSHSNRRNANMEGVGRYGDDTSLIGPQRTVPSLWSPAPWKLPNRELIRTIM
jgi:hypothetical protein